MTEFVAETIDPEQLEAIKRAWETDPKLVRALVLCVQSYDPSGPEDEE